MWIACPHLPDQVVECVGNVPVSFGRCFVEWDIPSGREVMDGVLVHFTLVVEIKLGTDNDDWNVLESVSMCMAGCSPREKVHTVSVPLICWIDLRKLSTSLIDASCVRLGIERAD